jgi:hypothetical protein
MMPIDIKVNELENLNNNILLTSKQKNLNVIKLYFDSVEMYISRFLSDELLPMLSTSKSKDISRFQKMELNLFHNRNILSGIEDFSAISISGNQFKSV